MYALDKITFTEADLELRRNNRIPTFIPVIINGIVGYYCNGYVNIRYVPYFVAKLPDSAPQEIFLKHDSPISERKDVETQVDAILTAQGLSKITSRICENYEQHPSLRLYSFSPDADVKLLIKYKPFADAKIIGGYCDDMDCNIALLPDGGIVGDELVYALPKDIDFTNFTFEFILKYGVLLGREMSFCINPRKTKIKVIAHDINKELKNTITTKMRERLRTIEFIYK